MSDGKQKGRFWKRLGLYLAIGLLALLSLSFIVHIPSIQTWGIRQISTFISNRTEARVEIRKFDFNIFKHFTLTDFYVADPGTETDTLVYAHKLDVRFTNLWSLTKNKLYLKEVVLEDALIDIERAEDAELNTLAYVISRLFETQETKRQKKGELVVLIDQVRGVRLRLHYADYRKQQIQQFTLPQVLVDVDVVDFDARQLIVDAIEVDQPSIQIDRIGDAAEKLTKGPKTSVEQPWNIMVCHLGMTEGRFGMSRPTDQPQLIGVDYANLKISNLDLSMDDVHVHGLDVAAMIGHLSFDEESGFSVTAMEALDVSVNREHIVLNDFLLQTPHSQLAHSIALSFEDIDSISSFADDVRIIGVFDQSRIAIEDLLLAIPTLQNSAFFVKNAEEDILLDGVLRGTLNRLRGEAIEGSLGDLAFKGAFRTRNLTIDNEQIINLTVDNALFSATALSQTIPGIELPAQFRKLGQMQFEGRFDGFFEDFVAFGAINSRLGNAELDMRLDLKPGKELASYSGNIELVNFDLETWTGNPDLGRVHIQARVQEGIGLTAETASATLSGMIHSLDYRDYTYEDVRLNGRLDKNFFDGEMMIADEDIDLNFLGEVDFSESVPKFDFEAKVAYLDLHALNLSQEKMTFSGDFDVRGAYESINAIDGYANASNVQLTRGIREEYSLDTISLFSERRTNGARFVRIFSDYVNGTVEGMFDFLNVYPEVMAHLHNQYPDRIPVIETQPDTTVPRSDFVFDLVLNDPAEWIGLTGLTDFFFEDLQIKGGINLRNSNVDLQFIIPELHIANLNFYEARADLGSFGKVAQGTVSVTAFDLNEKHFFDELTIDFRAENKRLDWHLVTDDLLESVNKLDLNGIIDQNAAGVYTSRIEPRELILFQQPWLLNPDNLITWTEGAIAISDFRLERGNERIILRNVEKKGVLLDIEGFDASYIDQLWKYDKLDFSGEYSLTLMVEDIFAKQGFYVWLAIPDFQINGDPYGSLVLDARMEVTGVPVDISLGIDRPGSHIRSVGWYYPPLDEVHLDLRNTLDMDIRLDTFPLSFLEYMLDDGMQNTAGSLIGGVRLFGKMGELDMSGKLMTHQTATTIGYLGTRYDFHNQEIRITRDRIDMDGAILTDRRGNEALVTGGMTHTLFSKFGLDARITSDKLVSLNTTKQQNPLYYGFGIGAIDARFAGPTVSPDISVDATALEGTRVSIAVGSSSEVEDETFIRFITQDSTKTEDQEFEEALIKGMNFDMNLSMTPDALVRIIFDERTDDIINVNGQGDMQLEITRDGEFNMYGVYEVEQGDYLFTNFVLNKPFQISQGGSLRWSGDPFNADMNIEATYSGLRTSLTTFLEEYLINASPQAREEAGLKQEVELTMFLTGSLLKPTINFDIRFPELTGELAGYAESKLRILETNENALNEQVFGLLWAGTFLPSNVLQNQGTSQLASSGIYNTLSEFFSTQLSSFLSDFLERAVADVDFISGIDFDVGYNRSYDFDLESYSYSEWELRMKNRLFDDRIILDVGGNYVADNPAVANAYFVGDYALEYILTADRRLKVRFYHRSEETIEGRKSKFGLGLSYRREFDTFGEWLGGLGKDAKKLKKNAGATDSGELNQ